MHVISVRWFVGLADYNILQCCFNLWLSIVIS